MRNHRRPVVVLVAVILVLLAALFIVVACNPPPAPAPVISAPTVAPVASAPAETPWTASERPSADEARPVVASSNALGFDLYPLLSKERGNLAFSPASIATALAMTWCGGRQATAAQMKKVLHAPA
jgi:serpin B